MHNKPLPSPPLASLEVVYRGSDRDRAYPSEGIYEKAYFTDDGQQRFPTPHQQAPGGSGSSSRQQAVRNKRLRNRSLEMVLDEPVTTAGSGMSPSRTR